MFPIAGESPKFAQIYFIDNRESEVPYGYEFSRGLNFRGFRESLNPRKTYFALTDICIL